MEFVACLTNFRRLTKPSTSKLLEENNMVRTNLFSKDLDLDDCDERNTFKETTYGLDESDKFDTYQARYRNLKVILQKNLITSARIQLFRIYQIHGMITV